MCCGPITARVMLISCGSVFPRRTTATFTAVPGAPCKSMLAWPTDMSRVAESADGFQNFAAAQAGLLRRAVGHHRNDHDVAVALRDRHPGFAVLRVLHAVAVVGILARAQIPGQRIERFQKSVQSPGGDHRHVGLVDVVFLNVLQHLAEHAQRPVGLVVVGLAEDVAQTDIQKHDYGKCDDGYSCEAAHRFFAFNREDKIPTIYDSTTERQLDRAVILATVALEARSVLGDSDLRYGDASRHATAISSIGVRYVWEMRSCQQR